MNGWYKKIIKEANEFLGVDGLMSPKDINDTRNFKANGLSPFGPQTLPGMITDVRNLPENKSENGWKRVSRCGEEPGRGGCGKQFGDGDCKWKGYPVNIDGVDYEAYECNLCKHELKLFDIQHSKHPISKKRDRRRKKRVRRLSNKLTLKSFQREAATPAIPTPGGINNPANQMQGRLDLTEDQRVIPWSKMDESIDFEYDDIKQKSNKNFKLIKIKGKDGKNKYIKVEKQSTGGEGVSPANTYKMKGRRKKHWRYNPSNDVRKGNPGSWPHNRDDNEGSYNLNVDKNRMNSDYRERAVPWSQYIQEKGNMGWLKPY
jgi:hypothetical protein